MELSYGAEYDVFREETRNFIEQNRDRAPKVAAMRSEQALGWQHLLIDNGYAAPPKCTMGFTDLLGLHFWFERIGAPALVREEATREQQLVA